MTVRTDLTDLTRTFDAHVAKHPAPSSTVITKGGTFVSPAAGTNVAVWRAPYDCTVTAVRALTKAGGSTPCVVNARRGTTDNLSAANLSVSTNNEWVASTGLQNKAFSAGDTLELMYISGSPPGSVSVQVDFTVP